VIKASPLYSVEEIRQEFKLCFDVFCMTSKIENENELSEEEALTCVQFKGEYQNVAECCRMLQNVAECCCIDIKHMNTKIRVIKTVEVTPLQCFVLVVIELDMKKHYFFPTEDDIIPKHQ
jgi:hypothetical protein